ncbi:hypothetical protein ACIRCZ_09860 [Leifsonia sp. NPDC102414]|nr:hypothetical protein [Leifsonia sp. Root227]
MKQQIIASRMFGHPVTDLPPSCTSCPWTRSGATARMRREKSVAGPVT